MTESALFHDYVSDHETYQSGTKFVLSLSDPHLYKNQNIIDIFVLSLSQVCPELVKPEINTRILLYCLQPQKILDIMKIVSQTNRSRFKKKFIDPLIECGLLNYTIPNNINDPDQKYCLTEKGKKLLEKISMRLKMNKLALSWHQAVTKLSPLMMEFIKSDKKE